MRLDEIDFELPHELIAQTPLEPRDASRLMVIHRESGTIEHRVFRELPHLLAPDDLLVVNDSRVLPARLHGHKEETGGQVELLLLRELEADRWEALLRPGRRVRTGTRVKLGEVTATCQARLGDGLWQVDFTPSGGLRERLDQLGEVPLPPYIHTRLAQPERYQTVYAASEGSAAAPTAGLHFTPELLAQLAAREIRQAAVTLHVGLDTFRPVQTARVEDHPIHSEAWHVPAATAEEIGLTRVRGGRVVAVGTTSVRVLETAAEGSRVRSGEGWTKLFITPGYRFQVVDALVTNFHLPKTTLIALVGAFGGLELLRRAYREAIAERYRLLSFGDAMLIL